MEIRKSGRGEKLVASVWTQSSSKCTPRNVTHFLAKIQKALPSSYWHGKTKQTLCGLNGEGLDSILGFWIFCSSHLYFMQVCFFWVFCCLTQNFCTLIHPSSSSCCCCCYLFIFFSKSLLIYYPISFLVLA
jgi:hypothetical protein